MTPKAEQAFAGVGNGYDDAGKKDTWRPGGGDGDGETATATTMAADAHARAQRAGKKRQQRGDGEQRVKEARWCSMMLARGNCSAAAMTAATEVAARSGGRTARPCSAGANIAATVVELEDAATMQCTRAPRPRNCSLWRWPTRSSRRETWHDDDDVDCTFLFPLSLRLGGKV